MQDRRRSTDRRNAIVIIAMAISCFVLGWCMKGIEDSKSSSAEICNTH